MATNSHVPRKFNIDSETPTPLSLVKMRLPIVLPGPGSILDSSAVTGATRRNYHTAIVRSAYPDFANRCIRIRVWPVPSYSFSESPSEWLATQPKDFRNRHIPFPCHFEQDGAQQTPTGFGSPLLCGGYLDRKRSWVFLEEIDFELPFTQTWKRFNSAVIMPAAEMGRLEIYYNSLALPAETLVGQLLDPEPTGEVHGDFSAIFGERCPVVSTSVSDRYSDDGDDDDGERSEDSFAFLRAMAPGYPHIEEVVARRDKAVEAEKLSRIFAWRDKVV